jgi:C-terminal processing protease CtpA/Prc
LKKAGDTIEMIVMREVLQTSEDINETNFIKEGEKFSTVIQKQGGQFGFSIAGGNQTTNGNDNLYISKVNNHEQNSPLAIGDRLLAINGHETGNITHDQVIDMITNGGNNVELVLYREKYTNGNYHTISTTNIDNTIEVCLIDEGN